MEENGPKNRSLAARTEPFDSYWQAPENVEAGYASFGEYYKANFGKHLPEDPEGRILVVSCGPGYLVDLLENLGYSRVLGIDSDPEKTSYAQARGLDCRTAEAFAFLEAHPEAFDLIFCEQELNHLTKEETVDFLNLCQTALTPQGALIVYAINGANPIVGAESLAQNWDHFHTMTEYSLRQVLDYCGYRDIQVLPLKLYVFYTNPLNYVGLAITSLLELTFRLLFKLYGKNNHIFTKKIAAVCRRPA